MPVDSPPRGRASRWVRCTTAAICVAIVFLAAPRLGAQPKARMNRLIEALEQGKPAITSDVWIFIDQEHGPYVIDRLGERLRDLASKKNDRGQQRLAPIVRIPTEGDQNVRW